MSKIAHAPFSFTHASKPRDQLLKLIKIHHSGMPVLWPRTGRGNYISVLSKKAYFVYMEALLKPVSVAKAYRLL